MLLRGKHLQDFIPDLVRSIVRRRAHYYLLVALKLLVKILDHNGCVIRLASAGRASDQSKLGVPRSQDYFNELMVRF